MPNREERRKYVREHKKNPLAWYCDTCKGKTLHFAYPQHDRKCDIICECCRTVVAEDVEGYIPYSYVGRMYETESGGGVCGQP